MFHNFIDSYLIALLGIIVRSATAFTCPHGTATNIVAGATTCSTCPQSTYCYYSDGAVGCCPKKKTTCELVSANSGQQCGGIQPSIRFYHNRMTHTCEQFTYFGCGGDSNNFKTQAECEHYCGSENLVCPNHVALQRDTDNIAKICYLDKPDVDVCSAGHVCTKLDDTGDGYCCAKTYSNSDATKVVSIATDAYICPSRTAEMWKGQIRSCNAPGSTQCSTGYVCKYSQSIRRSHCCLDASTVNQNTVPNTANALRCPTGMQLVKNTDGSSLQCSQYCSVGSCEQMTDATTNRAVAVRSCCTRASGSLYDKCPNGWELSKNKYSQDYCLYDGDCNFGLFCVKLENSNFKGCCKTTVSSDCPNGGKPVTNGGSTYFCYGAGDRRCQWGSTCQQNSRGTFNCCS